jgi:protein-L-isoaspartate(D-aspartate) O-methyltransferase
MTSETIRTARRFYAEELRFAAHVTDPAVIAAFATVPRERFLGPGPWQVFDMTARAYWPTPDADPRHLYHNILIGIDPARGLNNGQPEFWARLLDQAGIRAGETVFHVGAGTGYYTAILAAIVGAEGHVIAAEVDPDLAARAAANLAPDPSVEVVAADGAAFDPGGVDVIVVNAGATRPARAWLDALKPGGRLILPLTGARNQGFVLRLDHDAGARRHPARMLSFTAIYACAGARDEQGEAALTQALAAGAPQAIRSVRLDRHAPIETCWCHQDGFCLSVETP